MLRREGVNKLTPATGCTPKMQNHDFTSIIGKIYVIAVHIGQPELRGQLSDV